MRKQRTIVAIILAVLFVSAKAVGDKSEVKTLYMSGVFSRTIPESKWDEQMQEHIINWPTTENGWAGGNKIVEAKDLNIVEDFSFLPSTKQIERMKQRHNDSERGVTLMFWRLTEDTDKTELHCYFEMPENVVTWMWLGGQETYIVDQETGIHYKPRAAKPDVFNTHFTVKAPKGSLIDFTITFPPLPKTTKRIRIYGVPNWYLYEEEVKLPNRDVSGNVAYDKAPKIRVPRETRQANNYNKDNHQSWACFTDVHTIKPLKNENTYALWRTPDATYLAVPKQHTWNREYYGTDDNVFLIDNSGRRYKIKSIQGFPLNQIVWVEEMAGDWWAQVLVFEPLPLDVNTIHYIVPDSKPFKAWGANWKGKQVADLDVEELRENQKLFKYFERKIVE